MVSDRPCTRPLNGLRQLMLLALLPREHKTRHDAGRVAQGGSGSTPRRESAAGAARAARLSIFFVLVSSGPASLLFFFLVPLSDSSLVFFLISDGVTDFDGYSFPNTTRR